VIGKSPDDNVVVNMESLFSRTARRGESSCKTFPAQWYALSDNAQTRADSAVAQRIHTQTDFWLRGLLHACGSTFHQFAYYVRLGFEGAFLDRKAEGLLRIYAIDTIHDGILRCCAENVDEPHAR